MNTGSIRASVVAVMVLALAFAGCGGGGGDDQAQGTSTIQGNVTSFGTDVVAGVLPLITVSIQGTDLITTVAADGSFIITGVLAGDLALVFSSGDTVATYPVAVALNVTITLQDVVIAVDGTIEVGSEDIAANDPPPADPPDDEPTVAEQMVGTWTGTANFTSTGEHAESYNGAMTVNINSADGVSVSGSWSFSGEGGSFSGTPGNGSLSFALPNPDPGHEDCAGGGFSVTATITLSGSTLAFSAPGNYCSSSGSLTATLTK